MRNDQIIEKFKFEVQHGITMALTQRATKQ
jgi:hypothetical protein